MPFSIPLVAPRSTSTTLPLGPVAFPMMCAATVFDGECGWKIASDLARSAVSSSVRRYWFSIVNPVEFLLHALVFLAHVEQHEIIVEEMHSAAASGFDAARHRRDRRHRPDADQPHLSIPFHLVGEQHQLRQDHDQQDCQVAIAV